MWLTVGRLDENHEYTYKYTASADSQSCGIVVVVVGAEITFFAIPPKLVSVSLCRTNADDIFLIINPMMCDVAPIAADAHVVLYRFLCNKYTHIHI